MSRSKAQEKIEMKREKESVTNRAITWLAMLTLFLALLVLANQFSDGEIFYGFAAIAVIAVALIGLLAFFRATQDSDVWDVDIQQVGYMSAGVALYVLLNYLFDGILNLSIGQVVLRPQICIPILLGYAFGPAVGFFAGAVSTLLGDFVVGWGVFPARVIGGGLMGMVPGLVTLWPQRRNLPRLATLVIILLALLSVLVFIYPEVPEPWTGEVEDFGAWGWILLVGGVVMLSNRLLLEQMSVALAAVNLWGTLGIIVGGVFASVAHIWLNGYSLGTALIGELAPNVATDVLNLMIFAPLVLVVYNVLRGRSRGLRAGR